MVEILQDIGQLIVRVGGQEYTRYQYAAPRWKPYLYPIRAANGLSLVADAPTDHRHHHGFWVGHGRVDDVDFWVERHNSGRIVHTGFDTIETGDPGKFTARSEWIAPDGSVRLRDIQTYTFYDMPPEARAFDFELVLEAPGPETVTLYPTNEAGLPHLRVADGLSVKTGGTMTNAEGKQNERGTYRQASAWLDCSGKLGRIACGIAIFNHPQNPVHPTPWFTRDYGPISPNFGFFQEDPTEILPGKPMRLRYRVFTHTGDVAEGKVRQAWEDYVQSVPPAPTGKRAMAAVE